MIRQIDENILQDCLHVIQNSFMTVAVDFGLTKENCPTNGAFITLEKLKNDFVKGQLMFAKYTEEKIAGFMQLLKQDDNTFELEKLAVLPEFRHRGYGKELLAFAKSKASDLGAKKITIGIIEENLRLKNWYEANGFVHRGTKVFPHLPFTVGFMECVL